MQTCRNLVKVFQCLLILGENAGEASLRRAEGLVVSAEQFQGFLDRHRLPCLVPEDNSAMKDSSPVHFRRGRCAGMFCLSVHRLTQTTRRIQKS